MQVLQFLNICPKLILVLACAFSLVSGSPLQEVKNVNESASIRTTNSPPVVVEQATEVVIADERADDLTTRSPGEERSGSEDDLTTSIPTSEDLPEVELRSEITTILPGGRDNVDPTDIPVVTARNDEDVQWVVSDSATEPVANNEISGDDSIGKIPGARRFKRSFDDENWTYPTTPHPDNDTETSTIFPQLTDFEIPSERISNKILIGRKDCQCGTFKRKIVGGNDTNINEYPWTVALVRKGKDDRGAYCGGTLINDKYIATASHCVDGADASRIEVWLNHQSFQNAELTTTIKRDVESIIMHPNYDSKTIDNDIALLRLKNNVTIGDEGENETIIPACIPVDNSNTYEDYQATVCGWGATSQGGPVSTELKCVEVPVLSNTDCNWRSLYLGKITDNMLCAGELASGGKDSCQGDSGGPLVIQTETQKTLVGIVSFGYGCARPLAPGVYTRVGRFSSWIYQNTKDAEYCGSPPT